MRITNILIKLVGALALLALTFSCTDDTYDAPAEGYGFVQFKLVKNGGLTADKEITSRAANADILDSLADAKKDQNNPEVGLRRNRANTRTLGNQRFRY